MAGLKATPRNELLGILADLLASGKSKANEYEIRDYVPLLGGTGLGDLFMGKAPELVDDVSYDGIQKLIKGGNVATGGLGTYTLDPRTADLAMLGMDAGALAGGTTKLATKGAKTLAEKALNGTLMPSRREFLKKSAALGGSAAGAAAIPAMVRKASKLIDNTVPKAADNAAMAATKKHRYNSLSEYLDDVADTAEARRYEEASMVADETDYHMPDSDREKFIDDWLEKNGETGIFSKKKLMQDQLLQDEQMYTAAKNGTGPKLHTVYPRNPEKNITWKDAFSPQAKEEMRTLKSLYGDDWNNIDIWFNQWAR